jgi:hypothetical protein
MVYFKFVLPYTSTVNLEKLKFKFFLREHHRTVFWQQMLTVRARETKPSSDWLRQQQVVLELGAPATYATIYKSSV